MTARSFHLGDILSVTTGFLVSPRRMDGVRDVLNHMTGDNLFTHQIPRAIRECAPYLLDQHPDLRAVQVQDGFADFGDVTRWLSEQVAVYGEFRDVAPLKDGDHTRIDPITEMQMMRPDMPIIAVEL